MHSTTEYSENFYPASRIKTWQSQNGRRITLRPILPQDSGLLGQMLEGLSDASKWFRFHGAVKSFSANRLDYMSTVDHKKHVAFVITECNGDIEHVVADARYVVDTDGSQDSAEFAIVVDDQWQHLGLGEHCMKALTKTAFQNGLRWLHGDVLAHNERMIALMERCHFYCTPDRNDENIVRAEILLNEKNIQHEIHLCQSPILRFIQRHPYVKSFFAKKFLRGKHA